MSQLIADCEACVGLCCVALPFAASADFAIDKAEGVPCPNLATDHSCGIHDALRPAGFGGCVAFDCFGAGQKVAQVTFHGRDWRTDPSVAAPMFAAFRTMRQLHELLWYLSEAATLPAAAALRTELGERYDSVDGLTRAEPEAVVAVDVAMVRAEVGALLRRVSDLARVGAAQAATDLSGADLFGADLRGRDLRGADLRGAVLVGADLRRADLRMASLLGADLRGADLRGADLRGALFLTGGQLASARTDDVART